MSLGDEDARSALEALAARWAKAVEEGAVEAFDALLAADARDHSGSAATPTVGTAGFKSRTRAVHAAFGEVRVVVEDLVAEGDRMAWRWTLTGVHHGLFAGVSATGRRVRMGGINVQRVERGKIVEHWSQADALGVLAQLRE